ncbi:hypothetical protein CU098_002256 [Rhizopus stolonifer]|uniref:Uncharacterized protein n=1 Tax=Rhizopus stolonifer TaxID=4846 RepID=A0A367IT02_RHIST|nr:hypothetical protein CU098_002256 [Rhizopus stolonifer]
MEALSRDSGGIGMAPPKRNTVVPTPLNRSSMNTLSPTTTRKVKVEMKSYEDIKNN